MRRLPDYRKSLLALMAIPITLTLTSCKESAPTPGNPPPVTPGRPETSISAAGAFEAPRKAEGKVLIKIITNGSSPFWDAMDRGVEAMKKEIADADAATQRPEANHNAQKRIFEDAVAAGADGIAVSPVEADAFAPVIDSAIAKNIPVITYDSDSEKSKRLLYIGTNNYEAGKRAGEEAKKLFPDGGKLVAFVGNMSAQNARDRYQGFLDAIKDTKIEMLQAPFEDDKDTARARRNVQDAISKYGGQINGFLGLYSYNGPAIVDVVVSQNIRSRVKIICFDGEPKTLENLKNGLVDVTVVQKPYEFGRLNTKILYLINRKGFTAAMNEIKPELEEMGMKVNGSIIDTGVEVVTPANSSEFLQKLKEKGLEST